jgi:hypothetical protein
MLLRLFLLLCLLGFGPGQAWAGPPKTILIGYKKSESKSPDQLEAKWHLEPILRKQGWTVTYQDLDSSLPPSAEMRKYAAVLTWHRTARYRNPQAYLNWMAEQVVSGRKVVLLGNYGAHTADEKNWMPNDELNQFFRPFGLEYKAAYSGDTSQLELVTQVGPARPPSRLSYYLLFSSMTGNDDYLVVKRKDLAASQSALVVRTPRGGMALEGYLYENLPGGAVKWLIDREKFLRLALEERASDQLATGGRLLALYKGSEGVDAQSNYLYRFCREPLGQLGYQLDYRDIEKGLPLASEMGGYSGVISWYQTASMEGAANYCKWLLAQIQSGRKVVVLGNLGAYQELDTSSSPPTARWLLPHEYNTFLYPFGIEFLGMWTKDSQVLSTLERDPRLIPWLEPSHLVHYYWLRSVNPSNRVFLNVGRKDAPHAKSAFVVSTPYGGMVLENYLFRDTSGRGDYRWHIAIKEFLQASLAGKSPPVSSLNLDVKTRNPRPTEPSKMLPQPRSLPPSVPLLKRRVLAFYQRDKQELPEKNAIKEVVETVLNHLGLVVEYRAIEDPLPSNSEMEEYRGIVTWFHSSSIPRAQAYADWLKAQLESGRLAVVLGDYGAFYDSSFQTQVNPGPTIAALGLQYQAAPLNPADMRGSHRDMSAAPVRPSIEYLDEQVCKGEHPINLEDADLRRGGWPVFESKDQANRVYLRVKDQRGLSDVVVVTRRGGIAVGEFLMFTPPGRPIRKESAQSTEENTGLNVTGPAAEEGELPQWRIDPFRFFAESFQVDANFPSADVTTLNGSRIFFSHIDGDASAGISQIDRSSLNSEMMLREVLSQSHFPVTVSFVTSNLYRKATQTYKREIDAARAILQLPWVEPATHTDSHPFNWRDGDLTRVEEEGVTRLRKQPPNLDKEIVHSVDFTDQVLLTPGKTTKTLLWSGLCNPPEKALELCDGKGVVNMNGGDPIYDSANPFLSGVACLYQKVGDRYQFHTCAAGDFYYTSSWTRDFDGMKRLAEYFRYTEEPRRLRAMNLYYHFYLAEKSLGIDGLRQALDYVTKSDPAPLFVSDYVRIVQDMITMKLGLDGQGGVWVHNSGFCRTLRWDHNSKVPDLIRSKGVLGYSRHADSLYVHLDESKEHLVVLADKAGSAYLERASHYVEGLSVKQLASGRFSMRMKGTGPAHFRFVGMPVGTYKVALEGQVRTVVVSGDGVLQWRGELGRYQGDYSVTISR